MLQDINTLEMHGTGTPLGDPIEIGAAKAILKGGIPTCSSNGCNSANTCATTLPTSSSCNRGHTLAQCDHAQRKAILNRVLVDFNHLLVSHV